MGIADPTIFLAGIIQGSQAGDGIETQDYRGALRDAVGHPSAFPGAAIVDPVAGHPTSVTYTDQQAHDCFFEFVQRAARADIVVAYLPHASMGTAIEMHEARRHGRFIVAVTPMAHNWVVRLTASWVLPDLAALKAACADGEFRERYFRHVRP